MRNILLIIILALSFLLWKGVIFAEDLLDSSDIDSLMELDASKGNEKLVDLEDSSDLDTFEEEFKDDKTKSDKMATKTKAPINQDINDSEIDQLLNEENLEDQFISDEESMDSPKFKTSAAIEDDKVKTSTVDDLELLDPEDARMLHEMDSESREVGLSELKDSDDLDALKSDIGQIQYEDPQTLEKEANQLLGLDQDLATSKKENQATNQIDALDQGIFEVGEVEKQLLEVSKMIEGRIPKDEWDEIATMSKQDNYVIQKGDTLWSISQRFFGSGFYYAKVWSLNPQITNPHIIEPGMVLLFDTGDMNSPPSVKLGQFSELQEGEDFSQLNPDNFVAKFELNLFGDGIESPWLRERQELIEQGLYFTFATEETYEDLVKQGRSNLVEEYKRYTPPYTEIVVQEPGDQYDSSGFDKSSKIKFNYKEGFFLNTFVTKNVVLDLGEITNFSDERILGDKFSKVYVTFDDHVKVRPGDMFSVYLPEGRVSHPISDREGYRYSIAGQLKAIRKINEKWECSIEDTTGLIQRNDRITTYTNKITQINKTFNQRKIEAAVIGLYIKKSVGELGDVLYLDRGRADGVELGNVFNVYSSHDQGTGQRITVDPTYKTAELTVISLTDNFSTVLVTSSQRYVEEGSICITKTQEDAILSDKLKKGDVVSDISKVEKSALDELDVELNLDNISEDLLEKADKVKLTEDELDELERQERERSVIKDHERDLRDLERLEQELNQVEDQLNEAKLDEDKLLEGENLNELESGINGPGKDAFASLNEIEDEVGKKYLDEDLNAKENPYGLTKNDIEEIDELLNDEMAKQEKE